MEALYTIDYDYDDLSHLISEKSEVERSYLFDSLGNCLEEDGSPYTINDLNQVLEANGAIYTFDANGNLASKTVNGKTWIFKHNALDQLTTIKTPDGTNITFVYNLNGNRLLKKIEGEGKKGKLFRYFHIGQTEIGCLDEKGNIVELRIPSNPNHPEKAPFVAFEIKNKIYAPIFDLQGNVVCLIDPKRRAIAESYRYSAFGEEKIGNGKNKTISESAIGNFWRYRSKRIDQETGFIYFGKRYFDPKTRRWISPDPAGSIDGPNLYAFCRNNPLTYIDYFGLASEANNAPVDESYFYGEYEPHCYCERHRDCKRGGDITSALSGITHGAVDFAVGSIHGLQTSVAYLGAEQLELSLDGRIQAIAALEQYQANQMAVVDDWMMDILSVDEFDDIYQSFRFNTTLGLEVGSLVAGGYGAVKGVMAFNRLAKMPTQIEKVAKLSANQLRTGNGFLGHRSFELKNSTYQGVRNSSITIQDGFVAQFPSSSVAA